jgi:hypothetical protein
MNKTATQHKTDKDFAMSEAKLKAKGIIMILNIENQT